MIRIQGVCCTNVHSTRLWSTRPRAQTVGGGGVGTRNSPLGNSGGGGGGSEGGGGGGGCGGGGGGRR